MDGSRGDSHCGDSLRGLEGLMSNYETIEIIGTIAFFVFSLTLAYIAVHADRFTRYGQEALLAAAALLFTGGIMRVLVLLDWISREEAVTIDSAAACAFVLIGGQLALLRHFHSKLERKLKR